MRIYQVYVKNFVLGTYTDRKLAKQAVDNLIDRLAGTPLIDSVGYMSYKINNNPSNAIKELNDIKESKARISKINESFK